MSLRLIDAVIARLDRHLVEARELASEVEQLSAELRRVALPCPTCRQLTQRNDRGACMGPKCRGLRAATCSHQREQQALGMPEGTFTCPDCGRLSQRRLPR